MDIHFLPPFLPPCTTAKIQHRTAITPSLPRRLSIYAFTTVIMPCRSVVRCSARIFHNTTLVDPLLFFKSKWPSLPKDHPSAAWPPYSSKTRRFPSSPNGGFGFIVDCFNLIINMSSRQFRECATFQFIAFA
jgi:hypothetical protein